MNKATLLLATWTVACALLSSCADDGSADSPDPTTTPPTSTSPTPTTPTTPAWQSKYTDQQLQAYEAALARWEEYERGSAPIWRRGKATPAAKELFQEYFPSPRWQALYSRIQGYEQGEVTFEGRVDVYWSKPESIAKDGLSLTIEQCVDYSNREAFERGDPIRPAAWATEPRLRIIALAKPEGYDWLVYRLVDAASEKTPARCAR